MTNVERYLTGMYALVHGQAITKADADSITEPITDAQLVEMNQHARKDALNAAAWIFTTVNRTKKKKNSSHRDDFLRKRAGYKAAKTLAIDLDLIANIEKLAKERRVSLPVWDGREFATEIIKWLTKRHEVIMLTPELRARALGRLD